MAYAYETEKRVVFTDEGQREFLKVRDFCQRMLKQAGAVRAGEAMNQASLGDSWSMMACVDRLVELGEPPRSDRRRHVCVAASRFRRRPRRPAMSEQKKCARQLARLLGAEPGDE